MRPCVEGLCSYESLVNGVLSVCDVAMMNDALDVRDENQARINAAMANR